jgi:hypothetical protein
MKASLNFRATEHPSAHEAIQHLEVSGDDHAIFVGGKHLTVSKAEAERIASARIEFAYLVDHLGKIVTIPAGR